MICEAGDVVALSWRLTKAGKAITRPALVVSQRAFNEEGYSIVAMITDARHPPQKLDTRIRHESVQLKMASIVRMKLLTVETERIVKRLGDLSGQDRQQFFQNLLALLRKP
jgi:mRNA-degrading endonuclease toxin of MazEF toxin-antitoxin module